MPWPCVGDKHSRQSSLVAPTLTGSVCVWLRNLTKLRDVGFLRLWLQGDNTVKELRNSLTGKFACLLTSAGFFNVTSHHHLMVGHTHEDVGVLATESLSVVMLTHALSSAFDAASCRWSNGTGD